MVAALLAGGAACGGDEAIEPSAELVIGSAGTDGLGFVEIADGAEVELVAGSQGGFHIWTGIRARGASGELTLSREAVRAEDGTPVLRVPPQYVEIPELPDHEWWERDQAAASFMCPAPVGIRIFGTELAVTVTLRDARDEVIAEGHLVVTPVCPTGDLEAYCREICDG